MRLFKTLPLIPALLFAVLPAAAQENEMCMACHGEKGSGAPFVQHKEFAASIHGANLCVSCHTDASEIPHTGKLKPVNCGMCHRVETEIYLNSDHGRAVSGGRNAGAATCTSCHGKSHTLLSSRNPKSPVHRQNIPATCAKCHADAEKMAGIKLAEKMPMDSYLQSVHGIANKEGKLSSAVCSDCHGTHDLHASANPKSKIYRRNVPGTCGRCHENVREVYGASVHGKAAAEGIKESPVCTDCHGEHVIRSIKDPDSSVWRGEVTKTCSNCHDSEKIVAKFGLAANRAKSFNESYHGLASRAGDTKAANCASCHGWHDVLSSRDTRSSIHPKNLQQTCSKCHVGAKIPEHGARVHGGTVDTGAALIIKLVKYFYWAVIPLTIGGMLFFVLADYLRKLALRAEAPQHPHLPAETMLRMNLNERIQHFFLLVTFAVLSYTGFSLVYPDAWWSAPFRYFGGEPMRKLLHRGTAVVFIVVTLYHAWYMLFTRRGRFILLHRMFPKLHDLTDPLRHILYNIGFTRTKPDHRYPSFIEKSEYFALLWGTAVMILSGALLMFNDYTLRHLPYWVPELATLVHLYEAILAGLAILVWHSYWSVFDPDVYPMNFAWLTGRLRKKKEEQE